MGRSARLSPSDARGPRLALHEEEKEVDFRLAPTKSLPATRDALDRKLQASLFILMFWCVPQLLHAQTPAAAGAAPSQPEASAPAAPDWAQPGSPTHKQIPPPQEFHRPTITFNTPIGMFTGQSDIGGPLVPARATYDAGAKQYTIDSAGYNIWYQRDEFRYLWTKMSGDVSLSADVTLPNPNGFADHFAALVIRESLDDDSRGIWAGVHSTGNVHLAQRPTTGAMAFNPVAIRLSGNLAKVQPKRIGIEKRGDLIALFISVAGEPMHQFGPPVTMHFDGPFYVGIGFASHMPTTLDTAVFTNVSLKNAADKLD